MLALRDEKGSRGQTGVCKSSSLRPPSSSSYKYSGPALFCTKLYMCIMESVQLISKIQGVSKTYYNFVWMIQSYDTYDVQGWEWGCNILKLCRRKNSGIIGKGIYFATATHFFWSTFDLFLIYESFIFCSVFIWLLSKLACFGFVIKIPLPDSWT